MSSVDLITRKGCHLCDEALAALLEVEVEPVLRDVDLDTTLFDLYDFRVPVVLIEGRVVAEGRIGPAEAARIRRALAG